MALRHFSSTATAAQIAAALQNDGYAIVDDLVSDELMDRLQAEMNPYIDATPYGTDAFLGSKTRRTGALIARSMTGRELVMNAVALATAKIFLGHASTFQLHLTQIISVEPGSRAQPLHQDQLAWDNFPFPDDYHIQCNILWAMSDYTEDMGATRIVPGSQYGNRDTDYTQADSVPAVMKRGSALFYTGKVFHGAGANVSDQVRRAVNITYAVGWVRQEENQFLSTPIEIARTLPKDLLRVLGYQTACFALGYMRDFEDPMNAVHEPAARGVDGRNYTAKG
jgi:ectoine hydroxylase-related dioxygenase (phytanoyl-CoA dioxygenase family)